MAVIDADAPVVETERTWESMGFFAPPPSCGGQYGGVGQRTPRGQDSESCLQSRVRARGCQC